MGIHLPLAPCVPAAVIQTPNVAKEACTVSKQSVNSRIANDNSYQIINPKKFFKKFRKSPWQIEKKWYNLYLWIGFKSSRHISVVRFITPTLQGSGLFASLHSFLFLKLSHLRYENLWNWKNYSTWTLEIVAFTVWKSLNFTVWKSLNRPARGFWNPHIYGVKVFELSGVRVFESSGARILESSRFRWEVLALSRLRREALTWLW